jgi:hypothetical protein
MLIFLVLTALMRNDEGLLDYVSPYNMMYALPWLSAAKILTILMICGVSLITLLMATHLILRKTDLLFRSRNVG